MQYVAEHDSEQKRESCDCKQSRVYFHVSWNSVGVYDFLKSPGERVEFERSGRVFIFSILQLLELAPCYVYIFLGDFLQTGNDEVLLFFGTPTFALVNVAVCFEEVES